MIIDVVIVLLIISSVYRGREMGFIRQLLAAGGFVGGLFIGAALQPYAVQLAHSEIARAIISLVTTLGFALAFLLVGQVSGAVLKHKLSSRGINRYDNALGSVVGVGTLLISIWLLTPLLTALPITGVHSAAKNSHIIAYLNRELPSAPALIADVGRLISPNGFPDVFIGAEPNPTLSKLPSLGELTPAVEADRASVVKIEGQGCGGVVEGSGFVVGAGYVATNAHVIAGIARPYIRDANGTHTASAVWFDPNLDFAVLRASNLAGQPLVITSTAVANNTPVAVLGYPGGGALSAGPAAVLDQFTATGRDIYGRGQTSRDILEIQADIIPGNSGGPLIAKDGSVIGVIFAQSTTYDHVGYALSTPPIVSAIKHAEAKRDAVSTGQCAE